MDCIFCKIAQKALPTELLLDNEQFVAFKDINPQAPTHVLIIPKKHIHSLNDASPEDKNLLGGLMLSAKALAKKLGHAEDGYRLVINTGDHGGQTVYHIHLHLIAGKQMHWPPG
ncbi:MAG: histidine triad nucleotide-binding protein [Gammaproteobacteria bacterium]|nr:histidine triad nucleotide-binding protein [Gammaproteobacteria bacterium]